MAGINLNPDVTVIVGQGLIFTVAYIIVKKWIMAPYYKITARRHEAMAGQGVDLGDIQEKIHARKAHLIQATQDVYAQVQQQRGDQLLQALNEGKALVADAQESSDKQVKAQVGQLTDSLTRARAGLEQLAEPLVEMMYETWVHGVTGDKAASATASGENSS